MSSVPTTRFAGSAAMAIDPARHPLMDPIDPATLTALHRAYLPELLGIRFVEASPDRLVAEAHDSRRPAHRRRRAARRRDHGLRRHGRGDRDVHQPAARGLDDDARVKTNFFAAGRDGIVRAEATPLHGAAPRWSGRHA